MPFTIIEKTVVIRIPPSLSPQPTNVFCKVTIMLIKVVNIESSSKEMTLNFVNNIEVNSLFINLSIP